MKYSIQQLMRNEIRTLVPYSSARSEFSGHARIFLDANENWFDASDGKLYNRYPDPLQLELKAKIERVMNLPADKMVLGNGSDEMIDLLFRVFCTPGKDKVMVLPPTYGAYKVFADINAIEVSYCQLNDDFSLNFMRLETICKFINSGTPEAGMHKLIFICSPNNPSGTIIPLEAIERIASHFAGIVVVDEAYYDFSDGSTAISLLDTYPNLVVLRTFSKAWAMAGARVGMAFASHAIVAAMNKVKYPYNLSVLAQKATLEVLDKTDEIYRTIRLTIEEREKMTIALKGFDFVEEVFPSSANFLLVRVVDPDGLCTYLKNHQIIIRNRSTVRGCYGCVRITIGSPDENAELLKALRQWEREV